jgi:hypothetical protein
MPRAKELSSHNQKAVSSGSCGAGELHHSLNTTFDVMMKVWLTRRRIYHLRQKSVRERKSLTLRSQFHDLVSLKGPMLGKLFFEAFWN